MRKACIDCKHFRPGGAERDPWCKRFAKEVESSWNPVTGPRVHTSAPDCKVARSETGQCGPSGRSFEPKPGTAAHDEWVREEVAKIMPDQIRVQERPRASWWRRLFAR